MNSRLYAPLAPAIRSTVILLACGFFLALPLESLAQGFMVKPMKLELTGRPGQTIEAEVQVSNLTANPFTGQVLPVWLLQEETGGIKPVDPKTDGEIIDTTKIRSCFDWVTLNQSEMRITALENRTVGVRVKIPYGVRGTYSSAMIIRSKSVPDPTRMTLVIQFLVPILVQVQGPQARERLQLPETGMAFIPAVAGRTSRPATTMAFMRVINAGETFCRLHGRISIFNQIGARWSRIAEVDIEEMPILPGASVKLTSDLKRRLPSGRYRLQARLLLGTRTKVFFEQEIDFTGDPTMTTALTDVPLMLQPPEVNFKAFPGTWRAAGVTVENPSDQPLNLQCDIVMPRELGGVALGEVTGNSYSCAEWTTVTPSTCILRGGGRQSFRVSIDYAADNDKQPNYYALLRIRATYPDGQSAGDFQVPIWVENSKAQSEPLARLMQFAIAQQEENLYAVTTRYGNIGNVHLTPSFSGALRDSTGTKIIQRVSFDDDPSRVLPLSTPLYTGTLDFTKVDPGIYSLLLTLRYEKKSLESVFPLKVELQDNLKIVTVLEETPADDTDTPAVSPSPE
jgi:hypothetical protein